MYCIDCTTFITCFTWLTENLKPVNHSLTENLKSRDASASKKLDIFQLIYLCWKVSNIVFVFIVLGTLHLHRMQIYLTFMAKLIRQMDISAKSENPYLLIWDLISWITDFTWICFRIIHNIWNFECLCVSLLSFKLATFIGWHLWLLTK